MNVSNILMDSFRFPISNKKNLIVFSAIVLIYNLLHVFGTFFGKNSYINLLNISAFLFQIYIVGYCFKVVKTSVNGFDKLPSFDYGVQIVNGLKVLLLGIWYFLIPSIILTLGLLSREGHTKFQFTHLSPFAMFILIVGMFSFILAMFFYEIGLANMAYKEKIGAAMDLKEIKDIIYKIGWKKYFSLFIVILLIGIVCVILGIILNTAKIFGVLLITLMWPYLILVVNRIIGLVYRESILT